MGRPRSQVISIPELETPDEVVFQVDGYQFKVSPVDRMMIVRDAWYVDINGYIIHAETRQRLNRMIAQKMGLSIDTDIDHRDTDRRNNRRDNLRKATRSQNQGNTNMHVDNLTGYKGVTRNHARYMATITIQGKYHYLGTFDTPEQAHAAYIKAANLHFGEFARP